MNNIFLNDPLLYNRSSGTPIFGNELPNNNINDMNTMYALMYKELLMQLMQDLKFNTVDSIGLLDNLLKELDDAVKLSLSLNMEYQLLSGELQGIILQEIVNLIKGKLNTSLTVIKNIEKLKLIILKVNKDIKNDERKNISELNDYMNNYSHLTFDEYRQIKSKNNIIVEEHESIGGEIEN